MTCFMCSLWFSWCLYLENNWRVIMKGIHMRQSVCEVISTCPKYTKNSLETRPFSDRLYCSVLHYWSRHKQNKKIGGRYIFFLYHLVLIIVVYFLCFAMFDSLRLEQIVQFLSVQHTENIRLPYLKYQERDDINVAQTEEKKY